MNEEPDNFLARWSRRKRAAAVTPEARAVEDAPAPGSYDGATLEAERGRAAPECDLETADRDPAAAADEIEAAPDFSNVDFDKLDFESDYTPFMGANVDDELRNKALRKLWVSNPVLANMDGLDDYCEDYTDAAVCLPKGLMKTAYRYGRGFLDDDEVAEWEALGRPEPVVEDGEEQPGEGTGEAPEVAVAEAAPVAEADSAADGDEAAATAAEADAPAPGSQSAAVPPVERA